MPGTIGILAIGWIQGYYNMSISHAFDAIDISAIPKPVCYLIMSLSGIGVLWFIQILWVFSLILTLVRKIEKDKLYSVCGKCGLTALLLLTVLVYLSAQVLNTPVITVYRFGVYGTAYFIGYFILSHDAIIERLVRFRTPIGIASLILGVAYTTIYFGENYAEEPTINNALACAYAWLMTLATLAYMKARADNETVMTKLAAKMSWGLYVFHYLPLSMTAWYLHIYAPNLPVVAHYLLTGSAGFIGGALLYELVRRIPVLRWCVLGIRKERKNISGQI